jgi:hypothetical protein
VTAAPLLLAIAMCACYSPGIESACTIRCTAGGLCPDGFSCVGNNVCAPRGETCSDPPIDAAPDVPLDGAICWGHGVAPFLELCPTFPFPPSLTLPSTINTDTDCAERVGQGRPGATELCVFAAGRITISGTVLVRGPRPLLLLGGDAIHLEAGAVLDVASHGGVVTSPPGAPGPSCDAGNGGANFTSMAGGGGGGGSFGGPGGMGGVGSQAAGGPGGTVPPVDFLRGGCNGGSGGSVGATFEGGAGGRGGGAVYLMARTLIQIDGTINASGSGAGAAEARGGGGGGGSGGMIVLDANLVMIPQGAQVFALAGGGSSGGNATAPGNPGQDPSGVSQYAGSSMAMSVVAGTGGAGGAPSVGTDGTGATGPTGSGGGGGGGGGGVIRIWPNGVYPGIDPPL